MSNLIPDVGFTNNTEQRTPCVLVLDGSFSMIGEPINQLNSGLCELEAQLKGDPVASVRVQLLVIQVGSDANIISDWCDAIDFSAPRIVVDGLTALGSGMSLALDSIESQKQVYKNNGIPYLRPWIFMISDGMPTDAGWEYVAENCRNAEDNKKVTIFPIGTEDADMSALGKFSNNRALTLQGLQFNQLFTWLSQSVSSASIASPGEQIALPQTTIFQ